MKTNVVFRVFPEGDVVALFPDELYNEVLYQDTQIMSYMRVGQHGAASTELINELRVATPSEFRALKLELESIGYDLEVQS